jgi:hypothetical protein
MEKDYLSLKRASASRSSGQWSDDDYDVLANGKVVGRIFKVKRRARRKPVDVDLGLRLSPGPRGEPWVRDNARGRHGCVRQELAAGVVSRSGVRFRGQYPRPLRAFPGLLSVRHPKETPAAFEPWRRGLRPLCPGWGNDGRGHRGDATGGPVFRGMARGFRSSKKMPGRVSDDPASQQLQKGDRAAERLARGAASSEHEWLSFHSADKRTSPGVEMGRGSGGPRRASWKE